MYKICSLKYVNKGKFQLVRWNIKSLLPNIEIFYLIGFINFLFFVIKELINIP